MAITSNVIIFIFILGVFIFGFGYLQWYLSKSETRWYAYILPGLSFLFACFGSFGIMIYTRDVWPLIVQFITLNLPTLYFVLICVIGKEHQKKKEDDLLKKMKIKDL